MDPLTMLYALRTYDYHTPATREVSVVHKTKIGHYVVQPLGLERINVAGQEHAAMHVRVKRRSARDGSVGQLDVWLSDDERRLIVRLDIEAPVGLIRVNLTGQQDGTTLGGCIDHTVAKWAARH